MQKNTIKNINLYQTNCKFNQNLEILESENFKIFTIPNQYSIHRYAMTSKHINESSIFIFNASILNNEIIEFIKNTHEKLQIYILLDTEISIDSKLNVKYIEYPKYLINKQLYCNNQNKINRIVYFHNYLSKELNSKLLSLLYPNTKLNINIFDGPEIKHPLSLGFLNEIDKRNMLINSKYYIHDHNNYYLAEALAANCICLNLDGEHDIEHQIKNNDNKNIYYLEIEKQTIDYHNYIEDIIYG